MAKTKSDKKKTTSAKRETERLTRLDRAEQSPKVGADEKQRSKGRRPGSTVTADDELARKGSVRNARKTAEMVPLTPTKRSERPRPEGHKGWNDQEAWLDRKKPPLLDHATARRERGRFG